MRYKYEIIYEHEIIYRKLYWAGMRQLERKLRRLLEMSVGK
jgi:hypothetical protein